MNPQADTRRTIRFTGALAPLQVMGVFSSAGFEWLTFSVQGDLIIVNLNPLLSTGAYWAEILVGSENNIFVSIPVTFEQLPGPPVP